MENAATSQTVIISTVYHLPLTMNIYTGPHVYIINKYAEISIFSMNIRIDQKYNAQP